MTDSPNPPGSGQGRGTPTAPTGAQTQQEQDRAALDAEVARLAREIKVVPSSSGRPIVALPPVVGLQGAGARFDRVIDEVYGTPEGRAAVLAAQAPATTPAPTPEHAAASATALRMTQLREEMRQLEEALEANKDQMLAEALDGEIAPSWRSNPFVDSVEPGDLRASVEQAVRGGGFTAGPIHEKKGATAYPDSVSATPGASDFNALEAREGSLPEPPGAPPWAGAGVVHHYPYAGREYVIYDYAGRRRLVTTTAQIEEDARCHERWALEDAKRKEAAGPALYANAHKAPPPDAEKLARQTGVEGRHLCATCKHAVQFVAPVINPSGHDVFHQVRTLCSKVHDEDGESLQLNEVPVQYCSAHSLSLRKAAWRWAERNAATSTVAKRFLPVIRTIIQSY